MYTPANGTPESAKIYLRDLSKQYDEEKLVSRVLEDKDFTSYTGSGWDKLHHYGDGELVKHTAEVVHISQWLAKQYMLKFEDRKDLFFAALYHDLGKVKDYEKKDEWLATEEKYRIYHISNSFLEWNRVVDKHGYADGEPGRVEKVSHAILAHHGRREWKSVVEPQTEIAWILHLSDNTSAQLNHCTNFDPYKKKEE